MQPHLPEYSFLGLAGQTRRLVQRAKFIVEKALQDKKSMVIKAQARCCLISCAFAFSGLLAQLRVSKAQRALSALR